MGIGTLVGCVVSAIISVITGIFSDAVTSLIQTNLLGYVTNWVTIPVLGQVILWGQAISILVVIIIRVAVGLNSGILKDEIKAPEYLFKSIAAVVLIGIMPVLCNLVCQLGQSAVNDVATWATNGMSATELNTNGTNDILNNFDALTADMDNIGGFISNIILGNIIKFVFLMLILGIYLQLMVRQFEILIVSVIAPWAGIQVATENNSSQYLEVLTNLFGMFLTQAVQTLFLSICLVQYKLWVSTNNHLIADGFGLLFGNADAGSAWIQVIILLALLLATGGIPNLVDRWTFSGSSINATTIMTAAIHHRPGSSLGSKANGKAARATSGLMRGRNKP